MDISLYKAVLHTGGRTKENILKKAKDEKWIGVLTEEDIQDFIKIGDILDGAKVVIAESFDNNDCALIGAQEGYEDKVKEFIC